MLFLSRMVKQTASYCIVSKNDSEILLQPDTNEAKNGATSLLLPGDVPFSDTRTVRGAKDVMLPQLSDHSS